MNPLLNLALSNLVVASVLAGAACAAGHWGRRPALTHGLWLLVLLKLLTPPLFRVPVGDWLPRTPEATAQAPLAFEPAPLPQPVDEPAPLPLFDVEIAWDELWNVEMVPWGEADHFAGANL